MDYRDAFKVKFRRRSGSKKKDLNKNPLPQSLGISFEEGDRASLSDSFFLSPESMAHAMSLGDDDVVVDLASASSWDVATRYHEFKAMPSLRNLSRQLRKISADAVMARAQEVLGSVVHPVNQNTAPFDEIPPDAQDVDFDFDETLEQSATSLLMNLPITSKDLWMSYNVPRKQGLVLTVDTSLSMTGEKLALTAVAIAVVLLQFPSDPIGVIAFENSAKILKLPDENISIHELVERFLDVPAQGYTHLEDGLKAALDLVHSSTVRGSGRPASTVLLTDGKYTAGRDPAYLATRFPHLVVMKMGAERASLSLCQELASKGRGALRQVDALESLPGIMYSVVKDLLRGQS